MKLEDVDSNRAMRDARNRMPAPWYKGGSLGVNAIEVTAVTRASFSPRSDGKTAVNVAVDLIDREITSSMWKWT